MILFNYYYYELDWAGRQSYPHTPFMTDPGHIPFYILLVAGLPRIRMDLPGIIALEQIDVQETRPFTP